MCPNCGNPEWEAFTSDKPCECGCYASSGFARQASIADSGPTPSRTQKTIVNPEELSIF